MVESSQFNGGELTNSWWRAHKFMVESCRIIVGELTNSWWRALKLLLESYWWSLQNLMEESSQIHGGELSNYCLLVESSKSIGGELTNQLWVALTEEIFLQREHRAFVHALPSKSRPKLTNYHCAPHTVFWAWIHQPHCHALISN